MIPVDTPWHFTTWLDLLDHWQTGLAGAGAVIAAFGTIWMTRHIANTQIAEAREDANRVVAAAREQTATTVRLERERVASEASAFHAMLKAAMERVLAEAARARRTYQQNSKTGAFAFEHQPLVRQCITRGAFAELRAACVRQGGDLTGEFLDLEREIDSFAMQQPYADLGEQLASIERNAIALRAKAAVRISGSVPAPPRRNGGVVTGKEGSMKLKVRTVAVGLIIATVTQARSPTISVTCST